jgi:hypothetical protein
MILQGNAKYQITEVILHTADTRAGWMKGRPVTAMRDEIDLWHRRDRGWRKIGYHAVIAPDGSRAPGRALGEIGAHVAERNRGTLGICLVPVRKVTGIARFEDFYTPAQRLSLLELIEEWQAKTAIRWVTGHNDYAAKLCPGFKVRDEDWLP